jgi:hypothetical protein
MLTIPKCFSALVASGNGQKCNELKIKINSVLLQKDYTTGCLKVILFKYHKEEYPEIVKSISKELSKVIEGVVSEVDDLYFGNDLKKEKVATK